jgi:hypothetical protein
MKAYALSFNSIIDSIYRLPLEDRMEIKNLLEHNIADTKRNEIAINFKKAQLEDRMGKLLFTSNIEDLKKML